MLPGLTRKQFQSLLLSVGKTTRARRPLSPVEVGELCAKAMAAGADAKTVTENLKMTDRTMISKFLRVSALAPEIRHLVSWGYSGDGAIGFSVAALLGRLPEADQTVAAEAIIKNKLTRDEMISVIQLVERSKEPLQACIDRVLRRRPVVRVRQFILGAVTASTSIERLSTMSQLERDALLDRIVRRLYPEARDFTPKLGAERFAIIGGKSIAATVAQDSHVEQSINKCVEEEL